MGFANRKFAKVWDIQPKERYIELRITTSKKNKDSKEYEQDFSGFVRCLGKAFDKAKELTKGDLVTLGDVEVTTKYDTERDKTYTNFIVWDFEKQKQGTPPKNPSDVPLQPVDELDLPF